MPDPILDHLTRTATEHGRTALWLEALPWIVDTCGALGGHILVDLATPARRAHGHIEPALQRVIDLWEEDLLGLKDWMPIGGGSLTRTPPTQPVVASAELPIVHIPIYEGYSVIGGLSLVFGASSLPGAVEVNTANALTQSLARVATLAAERYQLQRRLTQGNLLYEVSRAISSSLEIDDVLSFTTALAANALGAEASALLLVDQKANELAFVIVHGALAEPLQGRRVALGDGIITVIVRTGQPLLVNNVKVDALFGSSGDSFSGLPVRNILCAPLQVKGETLGVLQVLNREGDHGFNSEDLEWLMALAGQASVAIENARLYSILREERDRIVQTEEEVRRSLARNLHDSAAQLMGSLLINIEIARKLAQTQPQALEAEFDTLRELAQQANQEMRQALLELRPLLLESRGLVGALQGYVNQQRRRGNTIMMSVDGLLPEIQNKQAETAVYLMVQEALTNVRKHANAQHTWLRITIQPPLLVIEVEDDGTGIAAGNMDAYYTERGRMGMLTMRERVQWLGGKISFTSPHSQEQRGTLVRIEIPLARLASTPGADTASWVIATQGER
ncbi:MAG TPA: GAF domain-containing protein [Anaerolineae bacterium]|nr:GAF domain-containing protein [Anaerolineae bacterium]